MYCRRCAYNLWGNISQECPECGREFKRDDPATYHHSATSVARICYLSRYTWCFVLASVLLIAFQLALSLLLEERKLLTWEFVIHQLAWILPVAGIFEMQVLLRGRLFRLKRQTLVVMALAMALCVGLMIEAGNQIHIDSGKTFLAYGYPVFLNVFKSSDSQMAWMWQVSGLIDAIFLGSGVVLISGFISDTAMELREKLNSPSHLQPGH